MSNILINGLKSKTGGGRSILNNYLGLLRKSSSSDMYYVLTPERKEYLKYATEFIKIIHIKELFRKNILFPFLYSMILPKLLKAYKIDLIFNLGDIVIPTVIPQLYLFDWPYAVYPESIIWRRMNLSSYLSRKLKLIIFKRYIKYASKIVAQSQTMKEKLESIYGLKGVEVIPNAVSLENMKEEKLFLFNLPKQKIKLLYLTYYYPHKNIEIFIPLARKIKDLSLPYCIVLTIETSQHVNAKRFINYIKKEKLDDIILNVGPVEMINVPSLYTQCDALLMPTLLESFSGTYVEAMFHNRIILTSNLDFAKDVCGNAAIYFDPLNVDSVLSAINLAFNNNELRFQKIEKGKRKLSQLLSWEQVFDKYQVILKNVSNS